MPVQPTSRPSFTSTVWQSPSRASASVNAAKFGGPSVKIVVGSKVQFVEGYTVWDVSRIFGDGTLYLSTMTGGRRLTRQVEPSDPSWKNIRSVDGRVLRSTPSSSKPPVRGGGPNGNITIGTSVLVGSSNVRWVVQDVKRDKSLVLSALIGDTIKTMTIGPLSRLWNSVYPSGT